MKRLLALSAVIAAHVTFGTSAAEAASDPKAAQLTYQPWAKICVNRPDGNSDCFTSSGAKGACQPSGGGIAVWIRDGIDQGAPVPIPDPNCGELGCRGKLDVDPTFIEGLKHSRTISVEAMTRDRQAVSLAFPLAGFTEAFDGPPGGPPKVPEVTSDELKERLKRTANSQPCE